MKILLVEDDALLGASLRAALGKAGFEVTWVKNGDDALSLVFTQEFLAMVLDLGLPKLHGNDIVAALRAAGNAIPILILTATDTTRDKVVSLERGADDFIGKTADLEELIARVRALIRRSGKSSGALTVGTLRLDLDARTVLQDGKAVKVSNREFGILRALMEGAGRVLTRVQLEQSLYGVNTNVESNAVEVHIHNLRLKLGSATLQTIRGIGYTIVRPQL